MAEIPRSSFIPKQSSGAVPSRVKKKRRFSALTYTGNVILVVSLLVAGGTFFYKDYVSKDLENTKVALEAERSRFNEAEIESVRELDYRFSVARLLLNHHLSPSKVFDTLELTTKERIQFTDFRLLQQPSQSVELIIKGGTEEFKTVALQSLTFGNDALFKEAVFTDITNQVPTIDVFGNIVQDPNNQNHEVSFSVKGTVAASAMAYDGLDLPAVTEEEEFVPEESVSEDVPEETTETPEEASAEPETEVTEE